MEGVERVVIVKIQALCFIDVMILKDIHCLKIVSLYLLLHYIQGFHSSIAYHLGER